MTTEEKLRGVHEWIIANGPKFGVSSCGSTQDYLVDEDGDGDFGDGVVTDDLGAGSEPGSDVYEVRSFKDGRYGDKVLTVFSEETIAADADSLIESIGEVVLQRALLALAEGG